MNDLEALANHCMDLAIVVGSGLHVFYYDNITSIFVEQRGTSSPAKVTSGTFGILYKFHNGNPDHMKLAPILERSRKVKGLDFNIRPSKPCMNECVVNVPYQRRPPKLLDPMQ